MDQSLDRGDNICYHPCQGTQEENPVEGIRLQVKNFIRRFYYKCKNFKIVKHLFQFFFELKLFNSPNLEKYDAFAQLMNDSLYTTFFPKSTPQHRARSLLK